MKGQTETYNIVLEATDPRIVDDELNRFRRELKEVNGEVFHTQTHVTQDTRILARLTAKYLFAMLKGKEPDIKEDEPGLVYTCFAYYTRNAPSEEAKEAVKGIVPAVRSRAAFRIKRENVNSKRFVNCPVCKQYWKYEYYSHCRCGNNEPPVEVREEYDKIWG